MKIMVNKEEKSIEELKSMMTAPEYRFYIFQIVSVKDDTINIEAYLDFASVL